MRMPILLRRVPSGVGLATCTVINVIRNRGARSPASKFQSRFYDDIHVREYFSQEVDPPATIIGLPRASMASSAKASPPAST